MITPGPWRISSVVIGGSPVIRSENGADIAFCRPIRIHFADGSETSISSQEAIHNACLIAAAPDLLETLRGCVAALSALAEASPMLAAKRVSSTTIGNHIAEARAAIAKAKGETE